MTLSSYAISQCAEINGAQCAPLRSGRPNSTADGDEGTLEDTKPVRDLTEGKRTSAWLKQQKIEKEDKSGSETSTGTNTKNDQTTGTNTTNDKTNATGTNSKTDNKTT